MEKKPNKKWNNKTNAQRRNNELKDNIKGFLIMTDRNKEKNSIKDAYNILNDIIEEHFSSALIDENNKKESSDKSNQITDELEKEIQQLKTKKNYFSSFDTHCNGVVFIKIAKEYEEKIDPITISTIVMNKVINCKEPLSKTITKFIPIELAIKAKFDIFKERGPCLLQKYFIKPDEGEEQRKRSWKLEFRSRNNNSVSKDSYMNFVSEIIGREYYYVDYKNPEMTVLLEITNDLLCLSVLEKYQEYRCYNIQALSKTEEELKKEKEKLIQMQNKNSSKNIIFDKKETNDDKNNEETKQNNHEEDINNNTKLSEKYIEDEKEEEESEEEIDII